MLFYPLSIWNIGFVHFENRIDAQDFEDTLKDHSIGTANAHLARGQYYFKM